MDCRVGSAAPRGAAEGWVYRMDDKRQRIYQICCIGLATLAVFCAGAAALLAPGAPGAKALCWAAAVSGCALLWLQKQVFAQMHRLERQCRGAEILITRDGLTDTYDRDTSLRLIDRFLQGEGREGVHGILMLELGGLEEIRAERGSEYMDALLASCAEHILLLFRKTDIIGRLREDAFVAFLKNVDSRMQLESQAATLLAELETNVMPELPLNCCIGGAVSPEDAADCATLLQWAESALERAKGKGKNIFTLYNPKTDDVFAV